MKDLTEKQQALLRFIVRFQDRHGFSPTLAQMAEHMGVASLNAVRGHLAALERKGYIDKNPGSPRATAVKGWKKILNSTLGRLQGRHGAEAAFGEVTYYLGWRTKKREPLLDDPDWAKMVRETIQEISTEHGWSLKELRLEPTRIHVTVTVTPDHAPAVVVQYFQWFAGWKRIRKKGLGGLGGMWDEGYAVGSTPETYQEAWREWEKT